MKVLGWHFQSDTCCNSLGELCHDGFLDFLHRARPDVLNVFYNLDWAVALLCHHSQIPEDQLLKFWQSGKLWTKDGYAIFFVPHRYLSIQKNHKEAIYTDIFQYQNELPFEVEPLEAAKKAQKIGEAVYAVLSRLELHPASLSSPIAAYQKDILSSLDLPKPDQIPGEAQLYAHYCLHGGFQQAQKIGHFDPSWDYDITSAFSFHTRDLLDTRYGAWIKSDKFNSTLPYGFCKGTVVVEKDFNPVIHTAGEFDFTPTGQRECYMTNKAIRQLYDLGIGKFKLECFTPDTDVWTNNGIKNITDIKAGDLVYSVNPINLSVSLKPVTATQKYPYNGNLYHLFHKQMDFMVTPEHNFILEKQNRSNFERITISDIVTKYKIADWKFPKYQPITGDKKHYISLWDYIAEDNIIIAKCKRGKQRHCSRILSTNPAFTQRADPYGYVANKSAVSDPTQFEKDTIYQLYVKTSMWNSHFFTWKYNTDDLLELIGWYVAEGNLIKDSHNSSGKPSYSIGISNNNIGQIEWLLTRMGIYYKLTNHNKKGAKQVKFASEMFYNFFKQECGEGSSNKKLPRFIFKLDHDHLAHLYKTLMAGDGCGITRLTKSNKTRTPGYFTISKQLADDFRQLCIHLGYKTTSSVRSPGRKSTLKGRPVESKHAIYCIYILNSREHYTNMRSPTNISKTEYDGFVYCITVKDNHTVLAGRNNKFEFAGQSGWYWKPDKLVYPLKEHIERLFEWKQYLTGFDREIVKRILVGLTGKLGEMFSTGEPGKLHNLPWYSWVQDQTKLQVADFVISNHAEDDLLSIAVDGCLFKREIPIVETGEIGTWRLNLSAPAFVVSSGVGCIQGKDGKGTFALNYDWLKSQIENNPDATEYKMTKLTPVTIGNALKNHKVDRLGELEMTERAVVLNEVKRYYPEFPKKGSDLMNQYSSEALDISQIEAESYTPNP